MISIQEHLQGLPDIPGRISVVEQSSSDVAAARRREYTQLVSELEEEFMQILNKSES